MTSRVYTEGARQTATTMRSPVEPLSADRARLFAGIFQHADVGAALVDSWGQVVESNPAFRSLVGTDHAEPLKTSLTDAIHPEDMKTVTGLLAELDRGTRDHFHVDARFQDLAEDKRWCRLGVSSWKEGDTDTRYYVATLTDITDIMQVQQELRALTMVDELTGLFNRRGFMTLGKKRLKHSDRNGKGLLVLFADVDGMKWINDNLGHHVGDQTLEEFARVLNRTIRRSDVAARIGGDEFAVITLDNDEGSAARVVDRIHANIEACNAQPGREYLLSCCLGVTRYDPRKPCDIEELLRRADEKMYRQKQDREDSSFKAKPIQ